MLISQVSDADNGEMIEEAATDIRNYEYQTADELYRLMANNNHFGENEDNSLTAGDLVLLYKNIDIGSQLMSNVNETKIKKPNQHVETIVHDADLDTDSDVSEIYSDEDLHNLFTINDERIDLLNNNSSLDNVLCHKYGDIELQTSISTDYDSHFLFKDPYIKEQLRSLHHMASSAEINTVLPASLLDYICCKRLEDNYNFYMDGIIRYVKHTIEQLKRISNGDYLTDKAKEKWREIVRKVDESDKSDTKVLTTSTSIPLHVERRVSGQMSIWNDIVHSEVDVRSLSKILEKKIIVEIPKLKCGSYNLFSKCYADNLIISCKREKKRRHKTKRESTVNVVVQLQRSDSGYVLNHINSIKILQSAPPPERSSVKEILALPSKDSNSVDNAFDICMDEIEDSKKEINTTELNNRPNVEPIESPVAEVICTEISDTESETNIDSAIGYESDNYCQILRHRSSNQEANESNGILKDILNSKSVINIVQREVTYMATPDELQLAMRRLNLHDSLPEESEDASLVTNKKKSSTKIRIKSPYENKSYVIEEKKRKKLLEIREKREKKKIALSEICNITKHKYGKNAILPQASSSVTKLSISNKSFYNSIYGNNINDVKQPNTKLRKAHKKDVTFEPPTEVSEVSFDDALSTPDKNSKKYINRSYYLDDAVTEIMFVEMKKEEKTNAIKEPESTSAVSTTFCNKLNLFPQFANSSVPEDCTSTNYFSNQTPITKKSPVDKKVENDIGKYNHENDLFAVQNTMKITPENIQKNLDKLSKTDPQKVTSMECKKSIEKVYNLMTKQIKPNERKDPNVKFTSFVLDKATDKNTLVGVQDSFVVQGTDSGTSLKHHLTSSNPSCFSFGKFEGPKPKMVNRTIETPSVIPKVVISTKSQTPKVDTKRNRRKCVVVPTKTVPDNPLKAISQLLHEFDNVQRTRQKITETKTIKKVEISDDKSNPRQNYLKRNLRPEQQIKEQCFESNDKYNKIIARKTKQVETAKTPNLHVETKPDKVPRNKIIDIINEVKEARGEAVRGPSKMFSRLQSLSQPKKSYVQAHSEEYQTRYGKNLLADRLQKLAGATVYVSEKHAGSTRGKQRRPELSLNTSVKQSPPHMPPLEKYGKMKYSAGSSPDRKVHPLPLDSSYKQNTADTNETLKKKMFAVESYVKNHYGRATTSPSRSPPIAQKARVPLIPKDIELASIPSTQTAEVSTELGNKLHIIINTMLNTKSAESNLTSVREYNETDSKNSKDDISLAENPSRGDELLTESDHIVDVFEDKNVITAVEDVAVDVKQQEKFPENTCNEENKMNLQKIRFSSSTELELEKALYRKISAGNFQKRLRIRNLTLTPKHSLQQAVILQSGDAGSLLAKPTLSQDLKQISSKSESISDFKIMSKISNTRLDWRFGKFPMQITTVGYVFPKYQSAKCELHMSSHEVGNSVGTMSDKTIQCFKAGQVALHLEQSVQANIEDSVIKSNTKYCKNLSKESERNLVVTEKKNSGQEDDNQRNSNDTGNNKETVRSTAIGTEPQDVLVTYDNSTEIETNSVKADVNMTTQIESQDVNYTTSLDMLVGLLNEIHKITTCEKHASDTKEIINEDEDKKLKTTLDNNLVLENTVKNNTRHIMSMTSFDKIKRLKSRSSIHALNLYDCREQFVNATQIHSVQTNKIIHMDKEVNVGIPEKTHVNAFTTVPSRFLPVTVNHSTSVTNSILDFISVSSSHSIFPNMDSDSSYDSCKKIINLEEHVSEGSSKKSIVGDQTREIFRSEEKFKIPRFGRESMKQQKGDFSTTNNKSYGAVDFDSVMKMKRDILVTLYSILVFTVFAALSFPEVLNRV